MCFVMKYKTIQYLFFKTTFRKSVELLLSSNTKRFHYILIKDFNGFMTNRTNHHGKKSL